VPCLTVDEVSNVDNFNQAEFQISEEDAKTFQVPSDSINSVVILNKLDPCSSEGLVSVVFQKLLPRFLYNITHWVGSTICINITPSL